MLARRWCRSRARAVSVGEQRRDRANVSGGMRTPRAYFAYLLRCGDGTYYAGYTVDPTRRLTAHRRGVASRYTRGRGPMRLAVVWRCPTLGAALRLERLLKRIPRALKRRLVNGAALIHMLPAAKVSGARRLRPRRMPLS